MKYALKRYIVSVIEAEEDGTLETRLGKITFIRGDKIATGGDGEQFIIPSGQLEEYYVPVIEVNNFNIDKEEMAISYGTYLLSNEENWFDKKE